ncbi:hypothetical protein NKG05_17000 [Oerskovia sp. M15]
MLTDEHSLAYLGPLPRLFAAVGRTFDELLDAYRDGGGCPGSGSARTRARRRRISTGRGSSTSSRGPRHGAGPACDPVPAHGSGRGRGVRGGVVDGRARTRLPAGQVRGYDVDVPSVDMARVNAEAAGSRTA